MKIAFVSTFYPFRGGIAQFNTALYRALEQNHEVKAFNFSVQYPSFLFPGKTQFVTDEDKADRIPSERILNSINPLSYHKTVRQIKQYQPDLVIIGYWMPYMAPSLGFIAKKLKKTTRVISIVHNAIPHEKGLLDRWLSNYFFKHNTHCVALSKAVENDILSTYPAMRTKSILHPVYNHFGEQINRSEALQKLNLKEDKKYLLFFGLIRDYKGLENLLLALKDLSEDYELIVAGEVYGTFTPYQTIIDKFNLQDRVHLFLEYIPDDKVKIYFSAADSVVLPYKSGTQSGIIAIAQHFNTPIVATDVGGLAEFISEKDGIVVPALNIDELKIAIKQSVDIKIDDTTDRQTTNSWERFANEIIHFQ